MYQYRIIRQSWAWLKFTVIAVGMVLYLQLGTEILRTFLALLHVSPVLAYTFNASLLVALLFIWRTIRQHRKRHTMLKTAGLSESTGAHHEELKASLKHLIVCGRRLSTQRLLPPPLVRDMLQQAHDLEAAAHHHPLRDDLVRGIESARKKLIEPAHRHLDDIAAEITRSRALAILQDIYQPPFPVLSPLVAFYHQATLASEIADLYLPIPSTGEYLCVIGDTWEVMTKGDFIRQGQRVFAGIETTQHFGSASTDIGQAISLIWLVHLVSRVARLRCCTLHDWDVRKAIDAMNNDEVLLLIKQVREVMTNNAMPVIKAIIRRHVPLTGTDPRTSADQAFFAMMKSFDNLIINYEVEESKRRSLEAIDRTSRPGPITNEDEKDLVDHHTRRHRRRKKKSWSKKLFGWMLPKTPGHLG